MFKESTEVTVASWILQPFGEVCRDVIEIRVSKTDAVKSNLKIVLKTLQMENSFNE